MLGLVAALGPKGVASWLCPETADILSAIHFPAMPFTGRLVSPLSLHLHLSCRLSFGGCRLQFARG